MSTELTVNHRLSSHWKALTTDSSSHLIRAKRMLYRTVMKSWWQCLRDIEMSFKFKRVNTQNITKFQSHDDTWIHFHRLILWEEYWVGLSNVSPPDFSLNFGNRFSIKSWAEISKDSRWEKRFRESELPKLEKMSQIRQFWGKNLRKKYGIDRIFSFLED